MDFSLTEDQRAVRELAERVLAPRAPTRPEAGYPPVDAMATDGTARAQLAQAGLLGLSLSAAAGGAEQGLTATALVLEQAGAAATRLPLAEPLAAALTIDRHGTDEQRADLLAEAVTGGRHVTAALHEPRAQDPLAVATAARSADDGWLVSGTKSAVTGLENAARVLVPARTTAGVALLLVDPEGPGVTAVPQTTTSGETEHRLTLEQAPVAAGDLVAGPDEGAPALAACLEHATLLTAAVALGLADAQLHLTAEHVSQREQFGTPLATFQGVAMRVADMLVDVEAMRATLWQGLWRVDAGLPAEEEIAIAAFWASDAGQRVASSAIHLHGGIGVDTDYPLHHYFLRSKVCELRLGSASWQLDRLGERMAARAGAPA